MNELQNQNDPRVLGNGDIFDNYSFDNAANWNFYERYMNGEIKNFQTGWVEPGDYETDANMFAQSIKEPDYEWLKYAHIFIIDGYTYPICPKLDLNAEKLAETMADMHADVLRIATSGHCGWMIPGTQFKSSPDLGGRDILAECIAACKPRGIKVIPYIATSHTIKTSCNGISINVPEPTAYVLHKFIVSNKRK